MNERKRKLLKSAATAASNARSITGRPRKLAPVTLPKVSILDDDMAADCREGQARFEEWRGRR